MKQLVKKVNTKINALLVLTYNIIFVLVTAPFLFVLDVMKLIFKFFKYSLKNVYWFLKRKLNRKALVILLCLTIVFSTYITLDLVRKNYELNEQFLGYTSLSKQVKELVLKDEANAQKIREYESIIEEKELELADSVEEIKSLKERVEKEKFYRYTIEEDYVDYTINKLHVFDNVDRKIVGTLEFEEPLFVYPGGQTNNSEYFIFAIHGYPTGCSKDDYGCHEWLAKGERDHFEHGGIWAFNFHTKEFKKIYTPFELGLEMRLQNLVSM